MTTITIVKQQQQHSSQHYRDAKMYVFNPIQPEPNVAKNTFKIAQIQRAFTSAYYHPELFVRSVTQGVYANELHRLKQNAAIYSKTKSH